MFCENCGNQMPDDSKFCMNCGTKIASDEVADPAVQEAAATAETAEVDTMPDEQTSQVEQIPEPQPEGSQSTPQSEPSQPAPEKTELIQTEPQPKPAQPSPAQYAPAQPAPKAQTYQQPVQPMEQMDVEDPDKVKPIPTWKFIGILVLKSIPIVGLIMVLIWSFGKSFNRNTRSYARAILILKITLIVLTTAFAIINWSLIMEFYEDPISFIESLEIMGYSIEW